MSNLKKYSKSKFIEENLDDFLNDSQCLDNVPKNKKFIKRRANIEKNFHGSPETKLTAFKKPKVVENFDSCGESRQKTLNVMSKQEKGWKHIDENLFKDLSDLTANFEVDYDILKENERKLEHLADAFLKCIQQSIAAHKDKLKAFKHVPAAFRKEAEGLLLRGAMKPDDRPLWFDVYKAFPPTTEPKFARPKTESAPIRQILYKEDAIRAKFHANGHGLSVNMLSLSGETRIKKLVENYQQLQSVGLEEEDVIKKSVEAVGSARREYTSKVTKKNPDSVTSKIFEEANLQNIFKE